MINFMFTLIQKKKLAEFPRYRRLFVVQGNGTQFSLAEDNNITKPNDYYHEVCKCRNDFKFGLLRWSKLLIKVTASCRVFLTGGLVRDHPLEAILHLLVVTVAPLNLGLCIDYLLFFMFRSD